MSQREKSLECPFTWDIDYFLVLDFDESFEPTVEVGEQPVLALMNSVLITYFRAVQTNYDAALKKLQETREIWNQIDRREIEKDELSHDVLLHIMKATEYHLFMLAENMLSEAKEAMADLTDSIAFQTKRQIGTVNGCKSIAWSAFHESGCKRAIPLAETAISNSPLCSLWHYILGKNLRLLRRDVVGPYLNLPSFEEKQCFLASYKLSQLPFYAFRVAQMYRENREIEKSKKMYYDIYECRPTNVGINLRLAQIFIGMKDFLKAQLCLEYVEKQNPNNPTLLHCKGCLFRKQGKLKEAALCLKEAAKHGNFRAEIDYAEVMLACDGKNFDYLNHLQSMLVKYKNDLHYKQSILLHMSMQYYHKKGDIENALKHVLKAVQLDPGNKQLKNFRNITIDWKQYYNIFHLVYNQLLPEYCGRYPKASNFMQDVLKTLKKICEVQENVDKNALDVLFENMNV